MQAENTSQRWGTVQITLHWLVVLAVAVQLIVGFKFGQMAPDNPARGQLLPIHAGTGLLILGLMLMRLYWRVNNPVPELPNTMTPFQKSLAHATHWALYGLLIGMPIIGYLLVSAAGHPIPFFNAQFPAVIGENKTLQYSLRGLHIAGALMLVGLLALHIGAALRHAWSLRDGVMERMAPFISSSNYHAAGAQAGEPADQDGTRAEEEPSAAGQGSGARGETGEGRPQRQPR